MSEENEIYKVDTVPPPDGESDVYNAATRVGAGPPVAVLDAMKEASKSGNPLKPQALPKGLSVPPSQGPTAAEVTTATATSAGEAAPLTQEQAVPLATLGARLVFALAVIVIVFALIGR